ncbi:hypothetical protein WA026_017496 [Henosepilachna vigintioctopunctata]|uniref:Uncharacterized protein n=1 Tax=Henosepilachna vigintioctopunctata TaxID=420089 RepID=A0AAW1V090_9CUCU
MEPLVHYSQRDPLYDTNRLSLHADGRYDQSKPLEDLQTEHNHISEHSYYPPRAQIIEKPVYIKEPEPIIEIIIKESNVTLPPPPTPPPTPPPKKKKEQVHVFYVKYKKNSNGYGKESIIYDKPIPAISPTVATEEEEEAPLPQYYPEPVATQPPPPSTTLRTIIKPDSEVYHGPSGIKVTFGKEGFDYHKRQSKPEDFNKPLDDVKFPASQSDSKFPTFSSNHQGRQLSFPPSGFDRQNNFERLNGFDSKRIPLSPVPNFRPAPSFSRQAQAYRPFSTPYKTPPASQFSRPQVGPPEYSTLPKSVYESQSIQARPQLPFPQFSSQYSTLPQLDQPRKPVAYQPFDAFRKQNTQKGRDAIPFRPQPNFSSAPQVPDKPKFPSFQHNPISNYKTIPDIPPLKPQFHNFRDGPHIQHQPQFNGASNINPKQQIPSAQPVNFQQTIQPQHNPNEFSNIQQQPQFNRHNEQPLKLGSPAHFSSNQQQNSFNNLHQNSFPQRHQFSFNSAQAQQPNSNQIQHHQNINANPIQSNFHLNTIQQVQNIAPTGSQLIPAIPRFEQHISSVEPTPTQNNILKSGSEQQFQNFVHQQPQVAQSSVHKQTAKPQNIRPEFNNLNNNNNAIQQYRQANNLQENIRNNYNPNPEIINYSTQKPFPIHQTTQNTLSVTSEKTTSTSTEAEKPSTTTKDPKVLNAQLPDEVPEELRQQLLSSGILNHADISVLDYDKVGDIPLSALPPDQLANFFNAGGAQQIAGSEPIPQYSTRDGDRIDKSFNEDSENDQDTAGSENIEVTEKPEVEMKVVHYDPLTQQGQQVQNSYVSQDATQVNPVALNDEKYNRYLPLKVSGAQFPIPDVPELKGKKIDSVVVLAPINFDYKPSRKTRDTEEENFNFVQGEELRKLLRNPTQENYSNFLKSEAKRKSDQQAVILLVTGSNEENREIYMYDVGTKGVNKLDGSLSAAFVEAAEENNPSSKNKKSSEDSNLANTGNPQTENHSSSQVIPSSNTNISSDKSENVASQQV